MAEVVVEAVVEVEAAVVETPAVAEAVAEVVVEAVVEVEAAVVETPAVVEAPAEEA